MKTISLCLIAALGLSACATLSQSRLNPLNWFGGSTSVATTQSGERRPLLPEGSGQVIDSRSLITTVTDMRVNRTPDGAIVQATGINATQGAFNAQLVPISNDNGTLVLAFRVEIPDGAQPQGTVASRSITAARVLDFGDLGGIRSVQVQGATNTRIASR